MDGQWRPDERVLAGATGGPQAVTPAASVATSGLCHVKTEILGSP